MAAAAAASHVADGKSISLECVTAEIWTKTVNKNAPQQKAFGKWSRAVLWWSVAFESPVMYCNRRKIYKGESG